MPHIFRKGDDGLLTELPRDYDYSGQMHSVTLMVEAIVLWNEAEIAERRAQEAREAERQSAIEAERAAAAERRAAAETKLAALGLTLEDIEVLRGS